MKTIKISVNKSEQQPEGVEIEVVEPEGDLEARVLSYLLGGFVRDTKSRGVLKLELPDQFNVSYEREGSFVLSSGPATPNLSGEVHTYYRPPQPLAVLAIHAVGGRLDVVYGQIGERRPDAAPPDAPATAAEPVGTEVAIAADLQAGSETEADPAEGQPSAKSD